MKKLLLLVVGGALSFSVSAQRISEAKGVPFIQNDNKTQVHKPSNNYNLVFKADPIKNSRSVAKGTGAGGDRWYSHWNMMDAFNNQVLSTNAATGNTFVFPIWFDTSKTQRYGNPAYYQAVNYLSMCQNVDPIRSLMFNDPTFSSEIQIKSYNSYVVDSIAIRGAYVRMPSRPSSVVDTLIFSVIPQDNITFFLLKSNTTYGSKIANYTTADTLWANAPVDVDSINRAAFAPVGTRAFWKEPLTATDGDTPNTTNNTVTVSTMLFKIPGSGVSVPAGNMFAMTATFKSGDNSTTFYDSVVNYHRFMPLAGNISPGNVMPYIRKAQADGGFEDRSMSGLMFSSDSSRYTPVINIEVFNTPDFSREVLNFAGHVVCGDCDPVSVGLVGKEIYEIDAYPNPAADVVNIPFILTSNTDATVTLTNAVGQVVRTQSFNGIDRATATFNTNNLTNGIYLYTVEANGQRRSGRVMIAK